MPSPLRPVTELDSNMATLPASGSATVWHDPGQPPFRLTGFPWYDRDRVFCRLPVQPAKAIRPAVAELAACTAGGQVAFRSDARSVAVRVELAGPAYMNHMPATGQCGFDLYLGSPLAQRYHNTARYDIRQTSYEVVLFEHPEAALRAFTLNFPLYQGVRRLEIGLPPGARLLPPDAWATEQRIIIYGTSITQGGCASRPGLAYPNILSRRLNVEVINLGFSGNGCGEPEVIELVAGIPRPLLIVLDYEANAGSLEAYQKTLPAAVRKVRATHRDIPVLVVSRVHFAKDFSHDESRQQRERRLQMQRGVVSALAGADPNLHFIDGGTLLGPDADECTVDGVHPNDIGFLRMANALEPTLRRILNWPSREEIAS